MNVVVIYDSMFGNTETLARGMAAALEGAPALSLSEATLNDLPGHDLLIVGSPTQGGRPTSALMQFLANIPQGGLEGMRVAAFDTRLAAQERGVALRFLMKVIGYAAPRIEAILERKGGQSAAMPEGFIVEDKEGPLQAGELERAKLWAESLLHTEGEQR